MGAMTDAPVCRVCGTAHWMRQPHIFKDEKSVPQDVSALVTVCMNLQKEVTYLRERVKLAEETNAKLRAEPEAPQVAMSSAERQRAYRERLKLKQELKALRH